MALSLRVADAALVLKSLIHYKDYMTPAELEIYQEFLIRYQRHQEGKKARQERVREHKAKYGSAPTRNSKLLRRAKTTAKMNPQYWEQVAADAIAKAQEMREENQPEAYKEELKARNIPSRSEKATAKQQERARVRRLQAKEETNND